jgi:exodeoxyribonuclease VII large subunit
VEQAEFEFRADDGTDHGADGGTDDVTEGVTAADEEATLSVGELTAAARRSLRRAFPGEVWVRGEVQNLTVSGAGHVFFALVERSVRGDRVQARVDVVLFRDERRAVERALRDVGAELADDLEVRLSARVELYAATGRFQLVMTGVDPVFTVGGLAAARDRVLRALAADGLLDENAQRPMPLVPLRIGLVTSRGSAAYHDFVHELHAAPYAWEITCVDVRVQGAAAARRIVWGLRALARRPLDVVVIARGGGSRADLAPFDTEVVARAVAAMPVPVVTGVGHEVDRSVVDEVAHTACKTPTACAHVLVARVRSFCDRLDDAAHRVVVHGRRNAAQARMRTDHVAHAVAAAAPARVTRSRADLDRAAARVGELGRRAVRDASRDVTRGQERVGAVARHTLAREGWRLDTASGTVRALDPHRVLERGYSITRDDDGRILRRAGDTAPGAVLVTELADGRVTSRVEDREDA